jgi:exonuclease SbcC
VQAQTALESAEQTIVQLKQPTKTFAEAENARQTANTELAQLRAQPSPGAAGKVVADAAQECTETRRALENARSHKDSAANAALQCAERLKVALEGIDPMLQTEQAVSNARKDAAAKVKAANEKHEAAVKAEREAEHELVGAKFAFQEKTTAQAAAVKAEGKVRKELREAVEALGWSADDYKKAKADIPQRASFALTIQEFKSKIASARDRVGRAKGTIEGLVEPDLAALDQAASDAGAAAAAAQERLSRITVDLGQQMETEARCVQIKKVMDDAEARFAVVGELKGMTNGENQYRMSLVDYAIAATFEDVLEAANSRFTRMSRGRYTLFRRTEMKDARSRAGLDIAVHDNFTDRPRDAHTLSGGESFMAALSLALGLSDVVQQRAGGIKLDVIFIDEGFGSLDDQTLDNALSTLRDLVGNNKAVGVISHVEMVKQQIQAGFQILRGSGGSRITPVPSGRIEAH